MSAFIKSIPLADHWIRRNPFFYPGFRRLLVGMERASLPERRALRDRLLRRAFGWAAGITGYRDSTQGRGSGGKAFADLPILTKDALQSRPGDFQRRSAFFAVRATTGGSTGRPLQLLRSPQSLSIEQATIDWLAAKAGVDFPSARVAVLRGDEIKNPNDTEPPFWRDVGTARVVLSSVHLNAVTFPHYEKKLLDFRPDILMAYPSSLEFLTHLAEERNSPLRFKLAVTSSEVLRKGVRARAKSVFDCALLDYYGLAERVAVAYSLEDEVYRFAFPHDSVEFRDEGDGKYGIIGTNLWNRAQPLLRYDTGDIALIGADASPERLERVALGLDTFSGIEGRASDCLKLADGSRVFGLDRIPSGVEGAAIVQIVQLALHSVLMIVVPNAAFSDHTLSTLRRKFYLKIPHSVALNVELREAPYRLTNGKAPCFISELT
jgi:phenylacetate-CoA ligase